VACIRGASRCRGSERSRRGAGRRTSARSRARSTVRRAGVACVAFTSADGSSATSSVRAKKQRSGSHTEKGDGVVRQKEQRNLLWLTGGPSWRCFLPHVLRTRGGAAASCVHAAYMRSKGRAGLSGARVGPVGLATWACGNKEEKGRRPAGLVRACWPGIEERGFLFPTQGF